MASRCRIRNDSSTSLNKETPRNLSFGSPCIEKLSDLVTRANDIISNLIKKSKDIPPVFMFDQDARFRREKSRAAAKVDDATEDADVARYQALLLDFSYLRSPEEFEDKLRESVQDYCDVEAEFALRYSDQLIEFYQVFDSIHLYARDIDLFARDLIEGTYIPMTLESLVLEDVAIWGGGGSDGISDAASLEGRQLLVEMVYSYGIMLLLLEKNYPGPVRERLIVAFMRYCGKEKVGNSFLIETIDQVCKLCRRTEKKGSSDVKERTAFFRRSKTEVKEPVPDSGLQLFSRFRISQELIEALIGRLISDDLYLLSSVFPSLNHRCTRLARQAAMVYVLMFFQPHKMSDEYGTMREIADKFFSDNWIIALPNSPMIVDLQFEWEAFPAAKQALSNVVDLSNVNRLHAANAKAFHHCLEDLRHYTDASFILSDSFVLDRAVDLLNLVRRANVALRWRLLHRRTSNDDFSKVICGEDQKDNLLNDSESLSVVSVDHIVSMLLLVSQLEVKLNHCFEHLLETKNETWSDCKRSANDRLHELSEYFTGTRALAKVTQDESLTQWFTTIADKVEALSYGEEHVAVTGRKIQQCVKALEDVERFEALDSDPNVKIFLKDTRALLLQMIKVISIHKDVVTVIQAAADIKYCWGLVNEYILPIQSKVRRNPSCTAFLPGLFLKLSKVQRVPRESSVVDLLLSDLEVFAFAVISVVPPCVFHIIAQIVDMKERCLKAIPTRVKFDDLKNNVQHREDLRLSQLCHKASLFSGGILTMEKHGLGDLTIKPKNIFEQGLRKELVREISVVLNLALQFPGLPSTKYDALVSVRDATHQSFSLLERRVESYKYAIGCIQDYICVPGSKIWVEEFDRVIDFNVQKEAIRFLKSEPSGTAQAGAAPIFFTDSKPIKEPPRNTFMGRAMSAILRITDSQYTIYSRSYGAFYLADGTEMLSKRTIALIFGSLGPSGSKGLDYLLSVRILHELQRLLEFYGNTVRQSIVVLERIRDALFPESKQISDAGSFYRDGVHKTERLAVPLLTCLRRVGQAQLLRRMIRSELKVRATVEASSLYQLSRLANEAALGDIATMCSNKQEPLPEATSEVLLQLSSILRSVGHSDPMSTIFLRLDPLEGLPVLFLTFMLSAASKMKYDADFDALVRSNNSFPIDGWPIVAGMATVLKQLHPTYTKSLLAYIGQYLRSVIQESLAQRNNKSAKKSPGPSLPPEVKVVLLLTRHMCSIGNINSKALFDQIPQFIIEMCAS